MKLRLDRIESRLQTLIEEWIVPTNRGNIQVRMAHQLVNVMQTNLAVNENGQTVAPDHYIIYLHPDILQSLENRVQLSTHLSDGIQQIAHEVDVYFISAPLLEFCADASLAIDEINVVVQVDSPAAGDTAIFHSHSDLPDDIQAHNPYLIVNGTDIFALTPTVINLGRRTDNHIVINDPRVSRSHAQIRFTRGHYVLFDLNSTGGTTVNGQRIHQYTLKPGDVISLSGVSIIYGEETSSDDSPTEDNLSDHTQAMHLPPSKPSSQSVEENHPGNSELT